MKKLLLPMIFGFAIAAGPVPLPHWTNAQAERLIEWLSSATKDGLEPVAAEIPRIRSAIDSGNLAAVDQAATSAAVRLVNAYRQGCCNASLRTAWRIEGTPWPDPASSVMSAVADDRLDTLFAETRPAHPFYLALREAYARERDPHRKTTLAANLDRWRWMPRSLGRRYLLVNTAAFEATLWEDRKEVGRWRVVVGKIGSPTPIFATNVTGVTFNPWWEIPSSIAAESVAALVRNHPAEAARKGYVFENGRYRQRPGPNNALGRMKLVMPNSYSVYLHDTPSQGLFDRDVRAFSHGCVRVGDALGLASTLLGSPDWGREQTEAAVASGRTRTVPLGTPIPVYIAYFTAEPDGNGGIRYFQDVYRRDRNAVLPDLDGQCPR